MFGSKPNNIQASIGPNTQTKSIAIQVITIIGLEGEISIIVYLKRKKQMKNYPLVLRWYTLGITDNFY